MISRKNGEKMMRNFNLKNAVDVRRSFCAKQWKREMERWWNKSVWKFLNEAGEKEWKDLLLFTFLRVLLDVFLRSIIGSRNAWWQWRQQWNVSILYPIKNQFSKISTFPSLSFCWYVTMPACLARRSLLRNSRYAKKIKEKRVTVWNVGAWLAFS